MRWAIKSRKSRTSLIDSFIVKERLAKLVRKLDEEKVRAPVSAAPRVNGRRSVGRTDDFRYLATGSAGRDLSCSRKRLKSKDTWPPERELADDCDRTGLVPSSDTVGAGGGAAWSLAGSSGAVADVADCGSTAVLRLTNVPAMAVIRLDGGGCESTDLAGSSGGGGEAGRDGSVVASAGGSAWAAAVCRSSVGDEMPASTGECAAGARVDCRPSSSSGSNSSRSSDDLPALAPVTEEVEVDAPAAPATAALEPPSHVAGISYDIVGRGSSMDDRSGREVCLRGKGLEQEGEELKERRGRGSAARRGRGSEGRRRRGVLGPRSRCNSKQQQATSDRPGSLLGHATLS